MASQNAQRQFRGVKSMRELAEAPAVTAFRARFEAGRSFDLDDDLEFCPGLLTEDDVCFDMRSRPYIRPLKIITTFDKVTRAVLLTSICSCTPSTLPPTVPLFPAARLTPRLCSTRSNRCSR